MSQLTQARSALPPAPRLSFPPIVKAVGEFVASRTTSAYLVGGAVRDTMLGRDTRDVDLAVGGDSSALGAELARHLGGRAVLLDASREIVRVVVPGTGDGSVVDLSPVHGDINQDLGRRDFTLDAMAVSVEDLQNGERGPTLIDPYHGASDLRAGVIRALSPSAFEDDPARLMRAPRLAAQLGFSIAEETAETIRRQAQLITTVAPERVRDELLKLLAQPSATSSLRLLDELGLLCMVIPELADSKGVTQPKEHHWDVFNHCIETAGQVERVVQAPAKDDALRVSGVPRFESIETYFSQEVSDGHTRLTMLKLAALLHDVAKPATRSVEPSGRIRFLGHHKVGARVTEEILGRLRLGGRGIELVATMIEHHLRPSQMAQRGEMPTARAVYRYFRDLGDAAIDTLYLNLADYLAARGPQPGQTRVDRSLPRRRAYSPRRQRARGWGLSPPVDRRTRHHEHIRSRAGADHRGFAGARARGPVQRRYLLKKRSRRSNRVHTGLRRCQCVGTPGPSP